MKNRSVTVLLFTMLLLLIATVAVAKPRVLLIESYHSENPWDIELVNGLKSVLHDKVELLTFQMDTKRLKVDEYEKQADLAWKRYLEVAPDVVLLSDDNALKYLSDRFLGTDTPVVYMGINDNPRNYAPLGKNITGVLERPLYKRTIKYLKQLLFVGQGKILIIFDEGTTSHVFKDSVFYSGESLVISGIHTDIKLISSYSEWKEVVASAGKDGYVAIVVGLYQRIFENGKHIDSEEVLQWTSENSEIPVFAFWAMSVGKGMAAGGMVLSGEEHGAAAGQIVLRILEGTPVNQIRPEMPEQGKFVFSQYELDRWKIRLPLRIREQSLIVP